MAEEEASDDYDDAAAHDDVLVAELDENIPDNTEEHQTKHHNYSSSPTRKVRKQVALIYNNYVSYLIFFKFIIIMFATMLEQKEHFVHKKYLSYKK